MKILDFEISKRSIIFLLAFSIAGLLFYQLNFSAIIGAKPDAKFTFFQFIGPAAGGILGPFGGIIAVLLVSGANMLVTGQAFALPVIVSFFTMSAAALYFGSNNKLTAVIAAACMLAFWLNPIGAQAWVYALFWLIPIGAVFFHEHLLAKSLGATFTAHAIGSVAYLYAFAIPAPTWIGLIPVVVMERLAFAAGICLFYYTMVAVLNSLSKRTDLSFLPVEKAHNPLKL